MTTSPFIPRLKNTRREEQPRFCISNNLGSMNLKRGAKEGAGAGAVRALVTSRLLCLHIINVIPQTVCSARIICSYTSEHPSRYNNVSQHIAKIIGHLLEHLPLTPTNWNGCGTS